MSKLNSPDELLKLREDIVSRREPIAICVAVCSGTGCFAYKSQDIFAAFDREITNPGLRDKVELRRTGCLGLCKHGPIVIILPEKICYLRAKEQEIHQVVSDTLVKKKLVEHLLYEDLDTGKRISHIDEIPFYKKQMQLLTGNNVKIASENIDDYIALGGYSALAKALFEMSSEQVLNEVKKANLRGRGGGGFPTARKWETTRDAPGGPKYVIINAHEGEPGAFMDTELFAANPHSVLEGFIIGAYAIGAHEGFVYVRHENRRVIEIINHALNQAREYGLLGRRILGADFNFDIELHRDIGIFVSGESTALMAALEGRVPQPRPKYIHTSVKGLWDKPTCLNNVETWANVPFIINNGAEWYANIGTEGSKGTKIVSVSGNIKNAGLVEVPMGTTLKEIVHDICGGTPDGKELKAVHIGGPLGGTIPASLIDVPLDFDHLKKVGSSVGAGGLIVMDENTCMVDIARHFIDFLAHESCGKCVPCREGLRQMLRILNNITNGEGKGGDIELLEELSEFMQEASLCALGQTAPNPVLSTIKHFRDEYEAHIKEARCPAGVCKALIIYYIDPDKCFGCGLCAKNCPTDAISETENKIYVIELEKCIKCGSCLSVCPEKAKAVVLQDALCVRY